MAETPDGSERREDGRAAGTAANRRRMSADERTALQQRLGARYGEGSSIRQLAGEEGLSYGFVHRLLSEGGTALRGRGGSTRRRAAS